MTSPNRRWGWHASTTQVSNGVDTSKLAFDSVTIADEHGARRVPAAEFLKMPLDQRIRLNFERRLRFHQGSSEIPATTALRSLMAAARHAA